MLTTCLPEHQDGLAYQVSGMKSIKEEIGELKGAL
jgi:hypothetical protein